MIDLSPNEIACVIEARLGELYTSVKLRQGGYPTGNDWTWVANNLARVQELVVAVDASIKKDK